MGPVFKLKTETKISRPFTTSPTAVTRFSWPVTDVITHSCTRKKNPVPVPVATRSAAAHLLRLWVRIPPGVWMPLCCDCCVLSGIDCCDELITRPGESYHMWCVVVCDLEAS